MKDGFWKGNLFGVVLLFLFSFHCGAPGFKVEPLQNPGNLQEEIQKLQEGLNEARNQGVSILSPTWFSKAETSLDQAQKKLQEKKKLDSVVESLQQGQAQLKKAKEVAELAQNTIPKVIQARKDAMEEGAIHLGEDFLSTEQKFIQLGKALEGNNLSWVQRNQEKILQSFREIELRAIKENTLGKLKKLIEQAKKEGAAQWVPKTLKQVEKKYQEADTLISQNPYQKEERGKLVSEALFQARRLLELSKKAQSFSRRSMEEIVLEIEEGLTKISRSLQTTDLRDQSFTSQLENLEALIQALRKDHDFVLEKLRAQEEKVKSLQQKIEGLESQSQTKPKEEALPGM